VQSKPPAKPAQVRKVDAKRAGGAEPTPVAEHPVGARRDPFDPLVGKEKVGPVPENLPPGKAGLQITTLRLDGVVRSPNGMIAVVSNPQQRVYFLRDGDRLYDGQVEHITLEGLSFHQAGTDPFGKPVEREVTKQLYPTPGELK
jgi:type IV pilus assembly protein PilP